jgi:protein arginine kinase activator
MICQICKKNQATIHMTQQKKDRVVKIHVCRQCAEEKGFDYLEKSNFAMGNLISGLFASPPEGQRRTRNTYACPNCGTSYDDFKEIARLGCSECYEFFKAQLLPVLRNLHVKTQHLGKFPASRGAHADDIKRITLLQEELERAVREECYERAAEIRDEIREIEGKQGGESCRH